MRKVRSGHMSIHSQASERQSYRYNSRAAHTAHVDRLSHVVWARALSPWAHARLERPDLTNSSTDYDEGLET